jgi:hypothetical protein
MPSEKELLALCLKWLQNPRKLGAFDRAMLIEAVQAKLEPRPWVGLTKKEVDDCYESVMFNSDIIEPTRVLVYQAIEAKLKKKNT